MQVVERRGCGLGWTTGPGEIRSGPLMGVVAMVAMVAMVVGVCVRWRVASMGVVAVGVFAKLWAFLRRAWPHPSIVFSRALLPSDRGLGYERACERLWSWPHCVLINIDV